MLLLLMLKLGSQRRITRSHTRAEISVHLIGIKCSPASIPGQRLTNTKREIVQMIVIPVHPSEAARPQPHDSEALSSL